MHNSLTAVSGLNLHALAGAAIRGLHPECSATLYQSAGQITKGDGSIKGIYAPGLAVSLQMQSDGAESLIPVNRSGAAEVSRSFYLFSAQGLARRLAGILRPLSRNGDMLLLEDASWWLVTAVPEDFSRAGWVRVRALLQSLPPDFSYSPWWTGQETGQEPEQEGGRGAERGLTELLQ